MESPCICLGSGGSAGQQEGDGGLGGAVWYLVSGAWRMVSGVWCLVESVEVFLELPGPGSSAVLQFLIDNIL